MANTRTYHLTTSSWQEVAVKRGSYQGLIAPVEGE